MREVLEAKEAIALLKRHGINAEMRDWAVTTLSDSALKPDNSAPN
jgi:hypothetical protein